MADKQMKFTLDFLAKTGGLKDAAELSDKLGDKLDEAADSGALLAAAMRLAADKIEADLEETRQIAGRLGDALGPELNAKLGQAGLDDMARKFQDAGLSVADVDRNIGELANGVKRLDDVSTAAQGIDKSMQDVTKTTDNSRSVMANFTGNAMQEIPGVSGAMGPLNMAIGQFAEYAAEGNIQLGKMAQMAGPMAGVVVALELVKKYMKEVAEVKAWRKDQVDGFVDSLKEGESVAADFRDRLAEAGKIEWHMNRMFGGDALGALAEAGLSVDVFTSAVMGGQEGVQKLSDALKNSGVDGGTYMSVMGAATSYQDTYNQSLKTHAELVKVGLAPALADMGDKAANAAPKLGDMAGALDTVGQRAEDADAFFDGLRSSYDLLMESIDEDQAWIDLETQWDDLRVAGETAFASAASGSADAEQAARDYQTEINNTKRAVGEYGKEVLGLPDEEIAEIIAEIDWASVDNAEATFNQIARNRQAILYIQTRTSSVGRDQKVDGEGAVGRPVLPGNTYRVGEFGPETLKMTGTGAGVVAPSSAPSSAPAPTLDPAAFGREAAVEFARVLRQQMRAS